MRESEPHFDSGPALDTKLDIARSDSSSHPAAQWNGTCTEIIRTAGT